jgi:hypothetical protein
MINTILIQSKWKDFLDQMSSRCISDWIMVLIYLCLYNRLFKLLLLRIFFKTIDIIFVFILNVNLILRFLNRKVYSILIYISHWSILVLTFDSFTFLFQIVHHIPFPFRMVHEAWLLFFIAIECHKTPIVYIRIL